MYATQCKMSTNIMYVKLKSVLENASCFTILTGHVDDNDDEALNSCRLTIKVISS